MTPWPSAASAARLFKILGACGCAAWWGTDKTQKYYQSHCHTVAGPLIDKADELPVHNRKGVGNLQKSEKEKGRGGGEGPEGCLRLCRRGQNPTDHTVTVAGPLILHFRKLQCAIKECFNKNRFFGSDRTPNKSSEPLFVCTYTNCTGHTDRQNLTHFLVFAFF